MLTRLEIDGFKNLFGVRVNFGPFTCIAGPNAVGKSNVFDVIEFLATLADSSFMEAAQRLRSAGDRPGDPRTLFWFDGTDVLPPRMRLAAEMIVDRDVEDDFGQTARATSTFLRYEIHLEYVRPERRTASQLGTIRLVHEDLSYVQKGEANRHLPWPHSVSAFRNEVILNQRSGQKFISTATSDDQVVIQIHQDGGSRGQPRKSSAERAPRTIVSTTNSRDNPTILAARREMQQWRKLALEPSAMRAPDNLTDSAIVAANGAHLARALWRLHEGDDPDVYARVASTASALTDVRTVDVDLDTARDLLTLQASLGSGPTLPARALSDGTLRFLALSIIEADPQFGGVLCMEEPENGIHPAKVRSMVDLLRDLSVDPSETPGTANPLRQVLVNTHSPRFVAAVAETGPEDLLLALPKSTWLRDNIVTTLDLVPMRNTWRSNGASTTATATVIHDYLTLNHGDQLELPLPERLLALD